MQAGAQHSRQATKSSSVLIRVRDSAQSRLVRGNGKLSQLTEAFKVKRLRVLTPSDMRAYYTATIIKIVWY